MTESVGVVLAVLVRSFVDPLETFRTPGLSVIARPQ